MRSVTWPQWVLICWIALALSAGIGAHVEHMAEVRTVCTDHRSAEPLRAPAVTSPLGHETDEPPSGSRVAAPVAVSVPAVGIVDVAVVAVGKTPEGAFAVPEFGRAGWYRHGARPGAPGAAVLAEHVDSTSGPDVFWGLRDVRVGDAVEVRSGDGDLLRFEVEAIEHTDKDELPIERVFAETGHPGFVSSRVAVSSTEPAAPTSRA